LRDRPTCLAIGHSGPVRMPDRQATSVILAVGVGGTVGWAGAHERMCGEI
jgi:hypothetical protein